MQRDSYRTINNLIWAGFLISGPKISLDLTNDSKQILNFLKYFN